MAARREHVLAALDVQAIVLAWLLVAVASSGALGCALSAVMVPLLCASMTCGGKMKGWGWGCGWGDGGNRECEQVFQP